MNNYLLQKLSIFILCLSFLTLAGCASRMNIPAKQDALAKQFPSTWNEPFTTVGTAAHLEELTSNQELKTLVQEALNANPNILATAYRLQASGLLLSVTSSAYMPSVSLGGSGTRSNASGNEADSYSSSINVRWEIDLWGRLADLYEADKLSVAAKTEDYIAARNALVARVMQAWIDLSSRNLAVEIQRRRIEALKNAEDIVLDRYSTGIGKPEDLATAKANTEAARQVLVANILTVTKSKRTMEILLGRYPSGIIRGEAALPIMAAPIVALPSSVLSNRPDIKAAWFRIQQADTNVSASNKAMLPTFTLSADMGYSSNGFSAIGTGPSVWNLVGSLSQPLFMGGKLKDTAAASSEESKAVWEEYRQVVLNAASEVENALENETSLEKQEQFLKSSLQYARESRINYEQQYREGLTDILNLLTAKNNELNTEAELLAIRTSRTTNRITLAIAVGLSSEQNAPITLAATSSTKDTSHEQ